MGHSTGEAKVKGSAWKTVGYDENGLLPVDYVHEQYKDAQGHATNVQARIPDDMAGWGSEVIDSHPKINNWSQLLRTSLHFYLGYISKQMNDNPELFQRGVIQTHQQELDRLQEKSMEKQRAIGLLDTRLDRAFTNMDYVLAEQMVQHGEQMLDVFDGPYKKELETVLRVAKNRLNKALGT